MSTLQLHDAQYYASFQDAAWPGSFLLLRGRLMVQLYNMLLHPYQFLDDAILHITKFTEAVESIEATKPSEVMHLIRDYLGMAYGDPDHSPIYIKNVIDNCACAIRDPRSPFTRRYRVAFDAVDEANSGWTTVIEFYAQDIEYAVDLIVESMFNMPRKTTYVFRTLEWYIENGWHDATRAAIDIIYANKF